nr:translation initiation factor IF-2-like [Setaria viridis]
MPRWESRRARRPPGGDAVPREDAGGAGTPGGGRLCRPPGGDAAPREDAGAAGGRWVGGVPLSRDFGRRAGYRAGMRRHGRTQGQGGAGRLGCAASGEAARVRSREVARVRTEEPGAARVELESGDSALG